MAPKKITVQRMGSPRSRGRRGAADQFLIYTPQGVYFQSYDTVIAFKPRGKNKRTVLSEDWNMSQTTSKYRNKFLGETGTATRQKIKRGVYRVVKTLTLVD